MVVLSFGLELRQFFYLHSIFALKIVWVAAKINFFEKLSGVKSLEVMVLSFQPQNIVFSSRIFQLA